MIAKKRHVRRHPQRSADAGELCDADDAADVLGGHLTREHAPQHLHGQRGHFPSLLDADEHCIDRPGTMRFHQPRRPDRRALFERDSQPADRLALLHDARHRRHHTQSFAVRARLRSRCRDWPLRRRWNGKRSNWRSAARPPPASDRRAASRASRPRCRRASPRCSWRRSTSPDQSPGPAAICPARSTLRRSPRDPQQYGPLDAVAAHAQRHQALVAELADQRNLQLFRVAHVV